MQLSNYDFQKRTKRKTPQLLLPFGTHARFGQTVVFDSRRVVNGHMLVAGPSGTGKSHQLNRMILSLAEQGAKQIFVIDIHGDLADFEDLKPFRNAPVPNNLVQSIKFGEQTRYGLPPLDLLNDPEGGPRKRANAFINLMERQGALGPKQKTALFRLVIDLYKRHGFLMDDPKTWTLDYDPRQVRVRVVVARPGMIALPALDWFDKNDEEKTTLKRDYGVRFNGDTKCWEAPDNHPLAAEARDKWGSNGAKRFPTLADVRRHLWDRLVMMKTGQSAPAIRALDKVMSLASKRARLRTRKLSMAGEEDMEKLESTLAKVQAESLEAFQEGMERVDSGQELEELLLWDSADAIKGLFDRIEALERSGIFKGEPPPFDLSVPIWRFNIKSLSDDEQMLFVDVLLERIFMEAKSRGEADGPDTFIFLDEAHKFVVDDGEHIINRIVKESRKFGVGLVLSSQAFVHFSDDLLMSSGLKLVLGCPEMYREPMRRKLGLEMVELRGGKKVNPLSLIRPKDTAMISISISGENTPMADIKIVAG
jgi:Helicase HerA, central domain